MVSITCTVNKGDFPLDIFWKLNGENVQNMRGVTLLRTNKRISQLSIDYVQAEHAGEYICRAQNQAGTISFSTDLHVNGDLLLFCTFLDYYFIFLEIPLVSPKILPFAFGEEPSYIGDSITVQCTITSGDMPISFAWFLNGNPIKNLLGISLGSFGKKTAVLAIDTLMESHAGNYTCVAQNKAGLNTFSAELIVKGTFFIDLVLFSFASFRYTSFSTTGHYTVRFRRESFTRRPVRPNNLFGDRG